MFLIAIQEIKLRKVHEVGIKTGSLKLRLSGFVSTAIPNREPLPGFPVA